MHVRRLAPAERRGALRTHRRCQYDPRFAERFRWFCWAIRTGIIDVNGRPCR